MKFLTAISLMGTYIFCLSAFGAQTLLTTQTPAERNVSDGAGVNYELGLRFTADADGQIQAIRFFKSRNERCTHTGRIFSVSGQQLAAVTFKSETASGWQKQALAAPLQIQANTEYVVSVNTGATFYSDSTDGFATPVSNGN